MEENVDGTKNNVGSGANGGTGSRMDVSMGGGGVVSVQSFVLLVAGQFFCTSNAAVVYMQVATHLSLCKQLHDSPCVGSLWRAGSTLSLLCWWGVAIVLAVQSSWCWL